MEPWSIEFAGRIDEHTIHGKSLEGNPLGDPTDRPLWVYTPPGYDDEGDRRYPTVFVIQGLTGQLDMWRNRSAFRLNYPELLDRAMASGECPPALVAFVDCWTSLGGSQFLDSPGTGNYHTFLCEEVVPFVDDHYRTIADRDHRGIQGKSSGGYGAMVTPLLRPDLFGGLATHAGDALFEACYLPEFREAARHLRDHYHGSFEEFWRDFRSRPPMSKDPDAVLMNDYCMAACYSTDADGTVRLPFDLDTGELIPAIWERWLAWDPVRMIPDRAEAARSLRAVYIDAGKRDEWYLDLGAEAVRREYAALGLEPFFELFEGTHMGVEYRYPKATAFLAERLA